MEGMSNKECSCDIRRPRSCRTFPKFVPLWYELSPSILAFIILKESRRAVTTTEVGDGFLPCGTLPGLSSTFFIGRYTAVMESKLSFFTDRIYQQCDLHSFKLSFSRFLPVL